MRIDAADLVGFAGSALFLVGFAYSNVAQPVNLVLFNALNIAGAVLLIVSLTVHFNLASMVLEVLWGAIATFGLVRALARGGCDDRRG